jgi:4-aminobutyrate aminotransferase-like enzyme
MPHPNRPLDNDTIRKYELDHVLYPWMAQKSLNPVVVERAKGSYFFDGAGNRILDFSSQFIFSNFGHGDERMTAGEAFIRNHSRRHQQDVLFNRRGRSQ